LAANVEFVPHIGDALLVAGERGKTTILSETSKG
jgi:hypothetical protein